MKIWTVLSLLLLLCAPALGIQAGEMEIRHVELTTREQNLLSLYPIWDPLLLDMDIVTEDGSYQLVVEYWVESFKEGLPQGYRIGQTRSIYTQRHASGYIPFRMLLTYDPDRLLYQPSLSLFDRYSFQWGKPKDIDGYLRKDLPPIKTHQSTNIPLVIWTYTSIDPPVRAAVYPLGLNGQESIHIYSPEYPYLYVLMAKFEVIPTKPF